MRKLFRTLSFSYHKKIFWQEPQVPSSLWKILIFRFLENLPFLLKSSFAYTKRCRSEKIFKFTSQSNFLRSFSLDRLKI